MSNKTVIWTERLNRWHQQSGSIKAFCQSEGISENSFYNWRKKLERTRKTTALVPVPMPTVSNQSSLQIKLRSGQIVMVDSNIDLEFLKSVVSILEAGDVC